MPNSMPSSRRSGPCHPSADGAGARVSWRPSQLLRCALVLLTAAACVSILLSGLPTPWAWAAIASVIAAGVRAIRTGSRRVRHELVIDASGSAFVDGARLDTPSLHWRGPIVRLDWRADGRRHSLLWWPDTLPPARRRELRLVASSLDAPPQRKSMAP